MSITSLGSSIDLPINIGTELLVEFQDFTLRTKSELVGMRHGQYLIIGMLHDMAGIRSDVIKESAIVVRYLYRGSVYGFKTKVLNMQTLPERLIFLSYPEKIEEFRVRSNTRYECILPAVTAIEALSADTVVIDISTDGCRCIIQASRVENAEAFYNSMDINREAALRVQFPGNSDSYELTGTIRNISKDADRIAFGLHFGTLKQESQARLEDFIGLISQVKKKEQ